MRQSHNRSGKGADSDHAQNSGTGSQVFEKNHTNLSEGNEGKSLRGGCGEKGANCSKEFFPPRQKEEGDRKEKKGDPLLNEKKNHSRMGGVCEYQGGQYQRQTPSTKKRRFLSRKRGGKAHFNWGRDGN